MAEAYYVPVSPHNAQGPGQILAGAHVMMATPNFYRLEHCTAFVPLNDAFLTEPQGFHGNLVTLNGKPGLGVDLDMYVVRQRLHPEWEWPGA
jgi:galactonate dehydratase